MVKKKLEELRDAFDTDLSNACSSQDLEALRIKYLGRKSPVQALMQNLRDLPPEDRPLFGKEVNHLKVMIAETLEQEIASCGSAELDKRLSEERVDVTLPGRKNNLGRKHPISQMTDEVVDILTDMGFSVCNPPEIESEYYNYGGLNYPPDHPARDMQDTFYLDPETLLRSHNTSIQQRIMEKAKPPIRIISVGKCYRNETITARSHVFFHQVDGLYIDKDVSFADLLATLKMLYSRLFNRDVELRVRASYFPFVEPGMEIDIACTSCAGQGCIICKHSGWLEVVGAGMVHPEVLREGGLDPEVYSGFAWGGGIDRLFMLRHGVKDIRLFTENNLNFLNQFN